MSMPTKTRFNGSVRPVLALLCAMMLGACAGESTGPRSPVRSGFEPGSRSDVGYATAERTADTVTTVLKTTTAPLAPRKVSKP